MVAVCPQCQMRYEVSQELLEQASPVLCPTCQVTLEMEQPQQAAQTDQQVEPAEAAAPPADQSTDLDLGGWGQPAPAPEPPPREAAPEPPPAEATPEPPPAEATPEPPPAEATPEPPPAEATPEPPPAEAAPEPPPAEPAPEVPSQAGDAQAGGWGTAPTWDDAGQETAGQPDPTPDQVPPEPASTPTPDEGADEDKPRLITEPEGPKNSWDAGELLWGDSSEGTDIADQPVAEPTSGEPPAPPAAAAEAPAEPPAADEAPAPPAAAAEAPAPPEAAAEAPAEPPAADEASAAPPDATEAPTAPPPDAGAKADVISAPTPGMDDWASAAAQWAASGFSTDSMPAFVKGRDDVPPEGQDPAGTAAPEGQPDQQPVPDADAQPPAQAEAPPDATQTSPGPAVQEEPPPAELPEDALEPLPAEPQQQAAPPAPPPLPTQQKKPIELPTPTAAPPPLNGQRRSSYVMKGSGEGVKEEMPPWMGESDPPPADQQPSTVASMAVPTQAPTDPIQPPAPVPQPVVPAATAAPKPPSPLGKILIVVGVLALVAAGGYAAWYFYQASQAVMEDTPGLSDGPTAPVDKVDAGAAEPPVADAGPAGKGPATGPEKGTDKKPDKKPGKKADPSKGPTVGKKRPKPDGEGKPKTPGAKSAKRMRDLAIAHVKKGNQLLRKKRYKEAIRFYRKALKADKAVSLAHRGLGVAYAQRGQNQKACREYDIYLKSLKPGHKEIPALKAILEKCK